MFQKGLFLLSFFFVFASHGEGKYVPITGDMPKEAGGKSNTDTKTCKSNKDCVLVNPGCCACSSGGESAAIHKNLVKSYNRKAREKCSTSVQSLCPTVYLCGKFQAKCKNSRCVKVKCPAGQRKICEKQNKKNDHNMLTIDPSLFNK